MSNELVAFIGARLDDDQAAAEAASPAPWHANAEHDEVIAVDDVPVADGFALSGRQLRATVDHIINHNPERVLRGVDAKRRMLEFSIGLDEGAEAARGPLEALGAQRGPEGVLAAQATVGALAIQGEHLRKLLAIEWSDHADYQQEWSIDTP